MQHPQLDTQAIYRIISHLHVYIPVAMKHETVSSVVITNLTVKSVSFEFTTSSNITLNKVVFTADPGVTELLNHAAISSTRSNITLVECQCLELQYVCILSKSSNVFIKNHFSFVQ